MGMCLEPTPAMGGIEVEVRSRSVTFYGEDLLVGRDGVLEIDIVDLPKLRAALEQAEAYIARPHPMTIQGWR